METSLFSSQRRAKIIATIGPATANPQMLRKLVAAGMDVARLNFSHGTHEEHAENIALLRSLARELGRPIAIVQDLQGPKLRVGSLPEQGVSLAEGQNVWLVSPGSVEPKDSGEVLVPLETPDLTPYLKTGHHILLDDGNLELETLEVSPKGIRTRVVLGGVLFSHKGVNLPGVRLDIPGFTEKDRADLEFGLRQGVDWVAISFVRSAKDVEVVRQAMHELGPGTSVPIIAKLERPEAVENLHEILHATDAVMVARGDLAVETSPEKVPIMQKEIIRAANRHAKLVITATQMLSSMIDNPRPTRAEATDVANAVFDGSDALMLSGETATGKYPVESVHMMDLIIREAEGHMQEWGYYEDYAREVARDDELALAWAAKEVAKDRDVAAIAVFTLSGRTAYLMSKVRPNVPIYAFTPDTAVYQRLGIFWNVIPCMAASAATVEEVTKVVEQTMVASSSIDINPGDQVVIVSGYPVGFSGPANFVMLHTLRPAQA